MHFSMSNIATHIIVRILAKFGKAKLAHPHATREGTLLVSQNHKKDGV